MERVIEFDRRLGKHVDKKHALTAPGQGNQEIGMGMDLIGRSKAAKAVWIDSDNILRPHFGFSFKEFVWEGKINGEPLHEDPQENVVMANKRLTKTENAQPAVLIDSDARGESLVEFGYFDEPLGSRPFYYTGNSLGFLTAVRWVGSISREGLAQLGAGRGEAFKYAIDHTVPTTMMTADTDPESLNEAKERFDLEMCLINTHKQAMFGGPIENIRQAVDFLKTEKGVKRVMSFEGYVDAAFHSKYMKLAVSRYREAVYDTHIDPPENGALIGASVKPKRLHTVEGIRRELVNQLTRTENWRDTMIYLVNHGVDMMTELNSKPRLTNMNIEMFGGARLQPLRAPSTGDDDRGIVIAQRWQAKELEEAA